MRRVVLIICIFHWFIACKPAKQKNFAEEKAKYLAEVKKTPARQFASYNFKANSSLLSRVNHKGKLMRDWLREFDDIDSYKLYKPNKEEMRMINIAIDNLPMYMKKVMKARLLTITFIEGFISSVYTEWCLDLKTNKVYLVVAIASDALKTLDANDLLQDRELTAFKPPRDVNFSGIPSLRIAPEITMGIEYILLHEGAHGNLRGNAQ